MAPLVLPELVNKVSVAAAKADMVLAAVVERVVSALAARVLVSVALAELGFNHPLLEQPRFGRAVAAA